jgi:hypothetical protein
MPECVEVGTRLDVVKVEGYADAEPHSCNSRKAIASRRGAIALAPRPQQARPGRALRRSHMD